MTKPPKDQNTRTPEQQSEQHSPDLPAPVQEELEAEESSSELASILAEVVDERIDERLQMVRGQTLAVSYKGPLPPPEMLEAYNNALEGSAGQILEIWKGETRHRQKLESRGQIFGLTVLVLAVAGAIICAAINQLIPATAFALTVPGYGAGRAIFRYIQARLERESSGDS